MQRRSVLMRYCEMCGAPIQGEPYLVFIEGARLYVCAKCAKKADSVISRPSQRVSAGFPSAPVPPARKLPEPHPIRKPQGRLAAPVTTPLVQQPQETVLVQGYGQVVKRKREEMGLTLAQLGRRINEKESVLRRLEEERFRPPEYLVLKLEKELGVSLRVPPPPPPASPKPGAAQSTLKDVAKLRE